MTTYIAVARHVEEHWVVTVDGLGTAAGHSLIEALSAAEYLVLNHAQQDPVDLDVQLSSYTVEDGCLRVVRAASRRPAKQSLPAAALFTL